MESKIGSEQYVHTCFLNFRFQNVLFLMNYYSGNSKSSLPIHLNLWLSWIRNDIIMSFKNFSDARSFSLTRKTWFPFPPKIEFFRQITKFLLISRIHVVLIHYLKVKNNLANQQKLRDLTEKFNFSAETEIWAIFFRIRHFSVVAAATIQRNRWVKRSILCW